MKITVEKFEELQKENADLKMALEDRQLCIGILAGHIKATLGNICKAINYVEYTVDDIVKMAKTGKLQNMKPIEELFSENPSGERVQNRTDNRRVPFGKIGEF